MSDENRTIDRRSLLKLIGATGATGAVVSACGSPFDGPVSAEGLTGGKFEKTVTLATAGPGGNKNWKAGDAVKFLPPQDIPTRGAASDVTKSTRFFCADRVVFKQERFGAVLAGSSVVGSRWAWPAGGQLRSKSVPDALISPPCDWIPTMYRQVGPCGCSHVFDHTPRRRKSAYRAALFRLFSRIFTNERPRSSSGVTPAFCASSGVRAPVVETTRASNVCRCAAIERSTRSSCSQFCSSGRERTRPTAHRPVMAWSPRPTPTPTSPSR